MRITELGSINVSEASAGMGKASCRIYPHSSQRHQEPREQRVRGRAHGLGPFASLLINLFPTPLARTGLWRVVLDSVFCR